MPASGSGHIVIHFPEVLYTWINYKDYSDYVTGYEFIKQQNTVSEFRVDLVDIGTTEKLDIIEGKDVQLRMANNLVFKGTIESADYKTYDYCTIKGYGTVESILKGRTVEWRRGKCLADADSSEGRPIYTYGAQSIPSITSGCPSTEIIAGQMSGISNITLGTNEYLGNIVARSDHDTVLSFLGGLADTMSGIWWTSYGAWPYNTNYFNVGKNQGSSTPIKTFYVTGDNQNADETSREVDNESLFTSIRVDGYGDGINQLTSKAYHATDDFTFIASGCSAIGLSMLVNDSSVLPASGTVWIGMEKATYASKSGNSLIFSTSGRPTLDGEDTTGQTYLKRYAHSKGVVICNAAYTETSTDGNSKIDLYGLRQQTFVDKKVLDQDTLDQMATNILIDSYTKKERIKLLPSDLYECLGVLDIGDLVTVTDAESGLSGDYSIVGERVTYNEGEENLEYELSNFKGTLTQDTSESKQKIKVGSQYMQGSTTIFNVQSYENCDATAGNEIYIRFYLPADLIKIDSASLDFKVKDYRAYNTTTPCGGGSTSGAGQVHSHTVTAATSAANSTVSSSTAGNYDIHDGTLDNDSWDNLTNTLTAPALTSEYGILLLTVFSAEAVSDSVAFRAYNGTTYYTGSSINQLGGGIEPQSYLIILSGDQTGKTITISGRTATQDNFDVTAYSCLWLVGTHTHSVSGQTAENESSHTHTTLNHTHTMSYAIDTTAGGDDAAIDIDIAMDDAETTWGRIATNETDPSSTDISNWIVSGISVGTGIWRTIKLTPDKATRVEANIFIKCYVQAK